MFSTTNQASTEGRKEFFERQAKAAAVREADRLQATVTTWQPEMETLPATPVTTVKTEAAKTMTRNIKGIARGFDNPSNQQAPTLLGSAARAVA